LAALLFGDLLALFVVLDDLRAQLPVLGLADARQIIFNKVYVTP